MSSIAIWLAASALYGLFLAWYQNRRGRISSAEIEQHMRRLDDLEIGTSEERAVLRRFLEEDDGREILMLNLVRFHPEPILDPVTGERRPARQVLERYSAGFIRALLRRGGHPAFLAVPVGGFVDTWGIDPGPGWNLVSLMRYRSRRDLIELVATPEFAASHGFKRAAMPITCSFPLGRIRLFAGPRALVGLVLALAAALLQLVMGT